MDVDQERLEQLAARLGEALQARGWQLVTAESCTGGWLAQVVTAIPGSSAWFDRGFVTYSNQAKREMLGVRAETLAISGAVSGATVCEMAAGALGHSQAQVAVAISGVAGPGGGSPEKPVGRVWLAWVLSGQAPEAVTMDFPGARQAVRAQAVEAALLGLLDRLASEPLLTHPGNLVT